MNPFKEANAPRCVFSQGGNYVDMQTPHWETLTGRSTWLQSKLCHLAWQPTDWFLQDAAVLQVIRRMLSPHTRVIMCSQPRLEPRGKRKTRRWDYWKWCLTGCTQLLRLPCCVCHSVSLQMHNAIKLCQGWVTAGEKGGRAAPPPPPADSLNSGRHQLQPQTVQEVTELKEGGCLVSLVSPSWGQSELHQATRRSSRALKAQKQENKKVKKNKKQ